MRGSKREKPYPKENVEAHEDKRAKSTTNVSDFFNLYFVFTSVLSSVYRRHNYLSHNQPAGLFAVTPVKLMKWKSSGGGKKHENM